MHLLALALVVAGWVSRRLQCLRQHGGRCLEQAGKSCLLESHVGGDGDVSCSSRRRLPTGSPADWGRVDQGRKGKALQLGFGKLLLYLWSTGLS